jgi:large repetitive protein
VRERARPGRAGVDRSVLPGVCQRHDAAAAVDPGGYFDSTYLSGNGWFVTQRFDATDPANATSPTDGGGTLQSLSFPYTDWAGNNYIAERVTVGGQPMFAITPVDASNGGACAIPAGGTTTPCLTTSIQFQEPNGSGTPADATAQLQPASAAAPTATATFPAAVSVGQPVTLTATGSDPDNLPLSYSWQLPAQYANDAISCPQNGPCDTTLTGASPSYTFTLPGVYQGTLTVSDSAGYSSTENFAVTVTGTTGTTITSSANPSAYGQPVTLTADVSPTLIGGNESFLYPKVLGYVQFSVDYNPVGQPVPVQLEPGCDNPCADPDGFATITLPPLLATAAGGHGHAVTAQFLGPTEYAASSAVLGTSGQVVNQASTVTTVASSANPSVTGQPVTFTASVAPVAPGAGLPIGRVQFQYDGQDLGGPIPLGPDGTATSPPLTPAHATQGGLTIGDDVTAVYSDGDGGGNFAGSSAGFNQEVQTDPTATTVTSSANPASYRQLVTFTATVAPNAPGSGTPTGQVQFSIDGAPAGSPVTLDANGTASLTTDASDTLAVTGAGTSFPTGHAISAQYLGVPCAGCIYYVPDFGPSTGTLNPGGEGQDVGPAQLTITASSPTVTYGDPVPAITPGYAGFVGGDTAASLTTAPTCVTTYQQGNGAGSYPASCQGAADPDYQIGYAGGAVTVSPATLTVTAKNASMAAGGSPPSYGFSLSGFIGSDGPSALSAQPACVADDPATGNQVSASTSAGTYPITCRGATAANYSFSYVSGTLTVSANATSLGYDGGQTVVGGSSFTARAQVSGAAAVCSAGQTVVFSLDRNPVTGASGAYQVGTATTAASAAATSVATTGWQQGVYVMTATAQANGDCGSSTATAALTVGAAGKAAAGAGWYSLPGGGKAAFSLLAAAVPHSAPAAVGVVTWSTSQWQLAGKAASYVFTGGAGSVTGTGVLSWWNPALNKGRGGWQLAGSGVAFTASFTVTGHGSKASPGTFGINVVYSPSASQPSLAHSAPQALGGGIVGGS